MKNIVLTVSIILTLACGAVFGQTTEFTFQGSLKNGANPAAGNYDFEFQLFDDAVVGTPASSIISRNGVVVSNGVFSVKLDFGAATFPAFASRYLQISVRQTGAGAFTVLTPRQAVTVSPYSIKSIDAINALNASKLGGLSSSDLIQNTTLQQASSNFNISGAGTANFIRSTGSADFMGSVGIGTTSPTFKLQVVDASNTGLRVQTNLAGGSVASFGGNGAFQVDAPGIVGGRFNVLQNGNVGIGITSPGEKLVVNGNIQSTSGGFKFPDGTVQTTAANTTYTKRRTSAEPPVGIIGGGGTGGISSIMLMNVPAGTYLVSITVEFRNNVNFFAQNNTRRINCQLSRDDTYSVDLPGLSRLTTTFQWLTTVPTSPDFNVTVFCNHSGDFQNDIVEAATTRLTAVKVEGNVIVQ